MTFSKDASSMVRRVSHSVWYGVLVPSMGAKNSAGVISKYSMMRSSSLRDGSAAPLVLIVVQLVLAALVSTLYNILFLYLAMAIGHLAQKHRVGMSVLAYVVMSTVLSTAYNTFLTPVVLNFMMGYDFAGRTNAQIMATISNGLWIYLAVVLAACAVFYFPTRYILQKKLNLE